MSRRRKRKPYVARDPRVTSAIMSKIGGKNTKAEVRLRRELWRRGWRYRLHDRRLPGSPDIVFPRARVAVFVDGDYWHGRSLLEGGLRAIREVFRGESQNYWIEKIKRNVARDRRTNEALAELDWTVVRVWERDILFGLDAAADRVETELRASIARVSRSET